MRAQPHIPADREERFRTVFLDAADAMFILDAERRVLDANRAAAALFELPIDVLATRALDELLTGDDDALASGWQELRAFGETKREHHTATRVRRIVECSYRASVHADQYLCIARDVTDRRRLEERLAQAQRIESVGRLAGGIAHDFNNLLTAILGYTELLLGNCAAGDPARRDLEEIQRAGQRAAALTQQLLAYSRKQVLQPKDVDLNEILTSLKGMLSRVIGEDIRLVCDLAPEPALLRVDPRQLEQIILNLVINSRDALQGGGYIRLEAARVTLSEQDVPADHAANGYEYVRLRVTDNGAGIAPDVRPHIFEPFFTTKPLGKGTGLGLAAVYGIVRQSQGFISVESVPGEGAAFTMHFPAADAARGTAASNARPARVEAETILLVEDEDSVRVLVGTILRRLGYRVLDAGTPAAATRLFEQHASEIDMLLTDVVMPGMNGPALARTLTAVRPDLKVLFISGYSDAALPHVSGGGQTHFLSKPFQTSVLISKVREILSRNERVSS
jgi:two-component system, cell cycle sensor histidine kinase and response regulator CckA